MHIRIREFIPCVHAEKRTTREERGPRCGGGIWMHTTWLKRVTAAEYSMKEDTVAEQEEQEPVDGTSDGPGPRKE